MSTCGYERRNRKWNITLIRQIIDSRQTYVCMAAFKGLHDAAIIKLSQFRVPSYSMNRGNISYK